MYILIHWKAVCPAISNKRLWPIHRNRIRPKRSGSRVNVLEFLVLSRGEEAAEHTKNPGCTNRGEDFCLASVISSAAMCNQLITQCNTVQFATIRGVDDGGLQLEEINFPFISFDYISSFLASSSLGAFGTVTKNHHGRLLGFQVAHAEQKPTAKEGIESFLAGFRIVQEKQVQLGAHVDAQFSVEVR